MKRATTGRICTVPLLAHDASLKHAPSGVLLHTLPRALLHKLTGNRKDTWSIRVTGNWRITFRFENGDAHDVYLEDYH